MNENDQHARAIARNKDSQGHRTSGRLNDTEKPVSRYTFFIIALVSLFAGSWATVCLIKAISSDGVMNLVKQLASALTGR